MSLWESSFVTRQSHLDSSGGEATCSPTGSELQRVPVDLLDMWAICLLVVAWVSQLLLYMQTHTHIVVRHICAHTRDVVHAPLYTHRSPLSVPHCVCAAGWCGVRFPLSVRPFLFLMRQSQRPKHISYCRKWQFV